MSISSCLRNSFAALLGIILTASVFTGCDAKSSSFKKKEDAGAQEKALTEVERNNGLAAFKRKDYKTAVAHFTTAAEQGDAVAQNMLGLCCQSGQGVDLDYTQAANWYRRAADQDYADAQLNLGSCYLNGYGVKQDSAEAVKWFRKAAEQDRAEAQILLGGCYENGIGIGQDHAEAVKWFRKAAELGNAQAQLEIAMLSMQEKKLDEAVKWFRKAAENDSHEAMLFLGRIYEKGMSNIKPNKAEAVKWYKKAAAGTDPDIVKEAKSSLNRLNKKK